MNDCRQRVLADLPEEIERMQADVAAYSGTLRGELQALRTSFRDCVLRVEFAATSSSRRLR